MHQQTMGNPSMKKILSPRWSALATVRRALVQPCIPGLLFWALGSDSPLRSFQRCSWYTRN